MTAAVGPQLVGLTMLDDEDKEGDKLGEEEDGVRTPGMLRER